MTRSAVPLRISASVLACLLVSAAAAETVVVNVDARPTGSAAEVAGTAEVIVSYGAEEAQTVRRSVGVPGQVEFDLAPGLMARVEAVAEGWWASPIVVHLDQPAPVHVLLRPTGWIAGHLQVPRGEEMPATLAVRVRRTPEAAVGRAASGTGLHLPEEPWRCPVEEGAFRCEVPQGRLDLRLRAEGFVSQHRWAVEVPAHEQVSIGTLELRPGASIVGWVEAPEPAFRFDRVRVRVRPLAAGAPQTSLDRERSAALLLEAKPNTRGFFEVTSIAPGSYEVVAEHEDFAPARIAPVTVLERAETEIHRIRLEPAVELEVWLSPPKHPFRQAWYVELMKKGDVPGHMDTVAEGAATLEGRWSHGGLAPGDYEIRVGDGRGSRWATQEVTLGQWRLPIEIDLPFERLEGTVRLADDPIAATLYFGGRHGQRRIPIRSDEDGKFYVFLPRQEDPWFADVIAPEKGIDVRVTGIEVRKLPGEPWAKTEIELPDTRVFGTVVDEAGGLLGGAVVEVVGPKGEDLANTRSSESEGDFQFVGLEAGSASIQARLLLSGRRLSSDRVPVEVGDREEAQPLRLVLREDFELEGLVVAPHGQGVPGAKVMSRLDSSQRPLLSIMPTATTDVDGAFTLHIPQGAQRVILSVLAPGYALRSLPVDATVGEPLLVELDSAAGTLVVSYSGGEEVPPVLRRHRTELFHPHLVAHSGTLRQWAELNGEAQGDPDLYVVPMLEPGPYTVCYDVGYGIQSTGWLPPGGLPDRCASGVLAPHGELHLTVPVPDADPRAAEQ